MSSRIWMMIATAIGIGVYVLWCLSIAFFALMAESGGKDSEPLLAMALLWPLGELIWTWMWLALHEKQYRQSTRRGLGNTLFLIALIVPPPLSFRMGPAIRWGGRTVWETQIIIPIAITIAGCWAARLIWSRTQAAEAEASSG